MKTKRVKIGTGYLEAGDVAYSSLRLLHFKPVDDKCNSILFLGGMLRKLKGKKIRLVAELL